MKKLILLILLLLPFLPARAVKKFDANPINVAVVLVEKADSANIESMFDYYGYSFQTKEDGYHVMKHPNGSIIRYSFKDDNITQKHPIIIIKPIGTKKETDATLKELKFVKNGHLYERMFNRYNQLATQCSIGPKATLIFKRIKR